MSKTRFAIMMLVLMLTASSRAAGLPPIQTVFIIVMENHNWSEIVGNPDAPYINNTLLQMASYCTQYDNPPTNHPSLPNYLWLEAGTNFGISGEDNPSVDHQNTTNHLVTRLLAAGISWKSYQEGISGTNDPLVNYFDYQVRHDPFVYFDDVTGTNDPDCAYAIAHIRPYTGLAQDLASNTVARYNFITPDPCDDMHDACAPLSNNVAQGDAWLSTEIPKLLNSAAYQAGGAIFLTWDEASAGDGPIPMIVLSPLAKGGGYSNNIYHTHSSTLRTFQEIFAVRPLLGDAANATDLSDLFSNLNLAITMLPGGAVQLNVSGLMPGKTNVIQLSTNLIDWVAVSTNVAATNFFSYTNAPPPGADRGFYRDVQLP